MTNFDQGKHKERLLANAIADSLLSDFVHWQPYTRPTGKQTGTKLEFCDLLIENDVTAVIVQLKSRNVSEATLHRNEASWALRKAKDAFGQVKAAYEKTVDGVILAKHPLRKEIRFTSLTHSWNHAIVLVEYDGSELILGEEYPHRLPGYGAIHYLTLKDFQFVCTELLTVNDLINYLTIRSATPVEARPLLSGERDYYAYYLRHPTNEFRPSSISDFLGEWDELVGDNSSRYQQKREEDTKARAFTELVIKALSTRRPDQTRDLAFYADRTEEEIEFVRWQITKEMNKWPRIPRRDLFNTLREISVRADSTNLPVSSCAISLEKMENEYILIASSRSERRERIEELYMLSRGLLTRANAKQVIGIIGCNMKRVQDDNNCRMFDVCIVNEEDRLEAAEDIALFESLFPEFRRFRTSDFPEEED